MVSIGPCIKIKNLHEKEKINQNGSDRDNPLAFLDAIACNIKNITILVFLILPLEEKFMSTFSKRYFKYIKAIHFLPDYCGITHTPYVQHKIRGIDGNGKEIEFTDDEKKKIRAGVKKLSADLQKKNL